MLGLVPSIDIYNPLKAVPFLIWYNNGSIHNTYNEVMRCLYYQVNEVMRCLYCQVNEVFTLSSE